MADQSGTSDEKYVVHNRKQWEAFVSGYENEMPHLKPLTAILTEECPELDDAVVIRRRDVFAPPALDAYANSILVALSMMDEPEHEAHNSRHRLQKVADYFAEQAALAWDTERKLPD